jgi:hypothetical protein
MKHKLDLTPNQSTWTAAIELLNEHKMTISRSDIRQAKNNFKAMAKQEQIKNKFVGCFALNWCIEATLYNDPEYFVALIQVLGHKLKEHLDRKEAKTKQFSSIGWKASRTRTMPRIKTR